MASNDDIKIADEYISLTTVADSIAVLKEIPLPLGVRQRLSMLERSVNDELQKLDGMVDYYGHFDDRFPARIKYIMNERKRLWVS